MLNKTINSYYIDSKSVIRDLEQHFAETYPNDYEFERQESMAIQEFEKVFHNDNVISFLISTYYHWLGDAHGQRSPTVINFNLNEGKRIIQVTEVFIQTKEA